MEHELIFSGASRKDLFSAADDDQFFKFFNRLFLVLIFPALAFPALPKGPLGIRGERRRRAHAIPAHGNMGRNERGEKNDGKMARRASHVVRAHPPNKPHTNFTVGTEGALASVGH